MTNKPVRSFKFEPIRPNNNDEDKKTMNPSSKSLLKPKPTKERDLVQQPPTLQNGKKIKEMCPYLFLGRNHSHPRIVFPHHSEVHFNNMGNGSIVIEEERHIQENGSYDTILDIHDEFTSGKKDLINVIEVFSNYSMEIHLIHIQGQSKGQEYDEPTWKKKNNNKSGVQQLDSNENVMLFIVNYSRNVFWTGFYFKIRKRQEEVSGYTNNNRNLNQNKKEDMEINPFITTLDLSRDPDLFKLFCKDFEYLGFLFEVCPCVK